MIFDNSFFYLLQNRNFYRTKVKPLVVIQEESIDINEIFDLFMVEMILDFWNSYKKRFSK